ncbi:hypothetical protein Gotri_026284 [Gossypium trilobum]|uniref:Uncharacterized protein n=1 Tax=Gossypium trilobum TaxID=34281 RepID=A0A7J9FK70_9ROSI|nr:hypothetical protein [Gossypium trilobum]
MVLCRRAKVPISENKQFMKPTRSIIRDTLYIQYVELYHKQIIEWNQRRKEKADVPASLKKKEQLRTRKGARGSTKVKLDGMIRWMQETRPVLQEFVIINGLPEPNYPPDMFGPIPTQRMGEGVGANFEEEGAAQEYPETEDEYEAAIQSQYSTQKDL